jgi:alpha-beta hydrolase superfamily lysophospholipase
MLRRLSCALGFVLLGALLVLVSGYALVVNQQPELQSWHLVELDQEFTAASPVADLAGYLELEQRLFRQLDALIYDQEPAAQAMDVHRYRRGSLSDPGQSPTNWNRTFELGTPAPQAGVLLLHGMSDSPYSLRALGQRLHAAGNHVLGLRMPGHGTIPSGLVELEAEDMIAATRLGVRHLAQQVGERPIVLVGYSTGAALAVLYALDALQDDTLPGVDRLVLLSPAIGVSPAAALASWQARIGHLIGVDTLAWTDILPEYDPYKYNSFAVNAGDVVYRLTQLIQQRITALQPNGELAALPPILAFASIVDATVSTPALVRNLFARLPPAGHELILFDINRVAAIEPLLTAKPEAVVQALREKPDLGFVLSVVGNADAKSLALVVRSKAPGAEIVTESVDLEWPRDVYSLSHVALPFPPDDPLYGGAASNATPLRLGDLALRGERGALQVTGADMLRLRWNPFFEYLAARVLADPVFPGSTASVQQ